MWQGRVLRHASLLLLFGVLVFIGVVYENPLDNGDGAYNNDVRELRDGGIPLSTLFHSRAYWRAVPLSLDRREYPYVTDAFVKEYLDRTSPPQLTDVMESRTLVSNDFFEELQLWRKPGNATSQLLPMIRAQVEAERVAARAEAVKQRKSKPWKTRRPPSPSLLSRLWPSFLTFNGNSETGEDGNQHFVEVQYSTTVLYHGKNRATGGNIEDRENNSKKNKAYAENGDEVAAARAAATSAFRYEAVSLETDEVQLVPFPFVPYATTHMNQKTVIAQVVNAETNGKDQSIIPQLPTVSVRFQKGKLRCAVSHRTTPHTLTHGWDHFYIALNLWKNEDVIPDLAEALVAFLEDEVKPHFNLATSVVVSIYANISPDRTAEMIEMVLLPRLHAAGVRTVYATTEGSCLGYVERQVFHERIEWMACIRNKALAPLYEHGMGVFRTTRVHNEEEKMVDGDPEAAAKGQEKPDEKGDVDVSSDGLVVLFFNDIFFRPQDITTLLESRAEAQMNAKVRPHGWLTSVPPSQLTSSTVTTTAATANTAREADNNRGGAFANLNKEVETPSTTVSRGTTFDMACGMDFYYTFYDTWVTRDRLGNPFEAQMPYTDDHATQEAFYRIFNHDLSSRSHVDSTKSKEVSSPETSALPVKCCWNGVAAVRGRFFLPPSPQHRQGFPPSKRAVVATEHGRPLVNHNTVHSTGRKASRYASTSEDNGTHPLVVERPSGAVYDLLGSVADAVRTVDMAAYYARVLTRRLQSERTTWNNTRREIAELTGHPFYQPVVYDNTSCFTTLLKAVMEQQQQQQSEMNGNKSVAGFSNFSWLTFAAMANNTSVTVHAGQATGAVPAGLQEKATAPPASVRVREDSAYYVARHPAVRFRHAFTPSYGATVNGLKPVRDDVCLSSECLLICQDVMQAAILQDRRAPVILLNPHVRVAYDPEHFGRITRHTWFFEHPYTYWAWVMARRMQLWWLTGSTSGGRSSNSGGRGENTFVDRGPVVGGTASAVRKLRSLEVREFGAATSAADDWLRNPDPTTLGATAASLPSQAARQTLNFEDGCGNVIDVGTTDITTLTQMTCQRITAGSIRLAFGAFFPLLRLCQLLVVALLLRWMCWRIQTDVVAKVNVSLVNNNGDGTSNGYFVAECSSASINRSNPAPLSSSVIRLSRNAAVATTPTKILTVEEQWWWALYNAIWYNRVARHVRNWVDALSVGDSGGDGDPAAQENARRGAVQTGDPSEAFYVHRTHSPSRGGSTNSKKSNGNNSGAPILLPPVPFFHLQLRHYHRRKVAAVLGSSAFKARSVASKVIRVLLSLVGTLCCVRYWCGCRSPKLPAAPGRCADTHCCAAWNVCMAGRGATATDASAPGSSNKPEQRRFSVLPSNSEGRKPQPRADLRTSPTYSFSYEGEQQRCDDYAGASNTANSTSPRRGCCHSSPGQSAESTPRTGAFRESGVGAENWPESLLQQPQPLQLRPARPLPYPQGYAVNCAAPTYGVNLIVSPPASPILVHAESPATTALIRSNLRQYNSGAGGALQSVRPRNTNARCFGSCLTHSPTSPCFGFPSGGEEAVNSM